MRYRGAKAICRLCRQAPETANDLNITGAEVLTEAKVPRIDGLEVSIIKSVFYCNIDLFAEVLNQRLEQGSFPKVWKHTIQPPHDTEQGILQNNDQPAAFLPKEKQLS